MDQQLSQLWTYAHLIASATLGGFAGVYTWLFILTRALPTAKGIEKMVETKMDEAIKSLGEIEKALKGDYEKKGLITRYHDLEKKHREIERRLEEEIEDVIKIIQDGKKRKGGDA